MQLSRRHESFRELRVSALRKNSFPDTKAQTSVPDVVARSICELKGKVKNVTVIVHEIDSRDGFVWRSVGTLVPSLFC